MVNIWRIYGYGWWLSHPSEKYESQLGWWHPQYMGKKNVPNHQPDRDDSTWSPVGSLGVLGSGFLNVLDGWWGNEMKWVSQCSMQALTPAIYHVPLLCRHLISLDITWYRLCGWYADLTKKMLVNIHFEHSTQKMDTWNPALQQCLLNAVRFVLICSNLMIHLSVWSSPSSARVNWHQDTQAFACMVEAATLPVSHSPSPFQTLSDAAHRWS